MAFIKQIIPETMLSYNYWVFNSFSINYINGNGIVNICFLAYKSQEDKNNGAKSCDIISQQVPFEVFIQGFKNMTGFTPDDIAAAIYTLKPYFEFFNDSEDELTINPNPIETPVEEPIVTPTEETTESNGETTP